MFSFPQASANADANMFLLEIYELLEERGVKYAIRIPVDDSRAVVRFYNKRGTAEVAAATIKEGKQAMKMTRLSCHHASRDRTRFGCG